MKIDKTMKRWIVILMTALAVFLAADLCARERGVKFSGGTDVVSGYIWRGVWEAGASLQPTLTKVAGNFSATAWGSVDFAATSYKEMDLTLAYALGPVTFSLADLYWEGGAGDRGTVSRSYFRFGADSPHRSRGGHHMAHQRTGAPHTGVEHGAVRRRRRERPEGSAPTPPNAEASYPFAVNGVEMKAGIGIVPWNAVGTYGIDRDFYIQNIFLNAGKSWTVLGSLQLGIFTSLGWNPAAEDVNFVGGFSFRM